MGVNPASVIGGFAKNPLLEQIFVWQILQQITAALLAAPMTGIQAESFRLDQSAPLGAAEAAQAVIRGYLDRNAGRDEAALTGISNPRFDLLTSIAGQPLPLQALTEAWRRKLIPQAGLGADSISLEQGIRESDLKDKWIPIVEALQFQLAPVGTVIEGWLRAQLTEAEARAILYKAGVDDATATLMYKSAGRPPSPQELLDLYHRGLIKHDGRGGDALTLEQGYLETDLKDKWWPLFTALGDYLPPPRTITALLRAGSMTDAQALDYYQKQGLSAELAAIYINDAHHQRTAATKDLAKGTVLQMYAVKEIDATQAGAMLTSLGYTSDEVAFELGYQDFKLIESQVTNALSRLRTLYIAHKLTKPAALAAIDTLGLGAPARDHLLTVWEQERANNVAILTAAEVGILFKARLMSFDDASNRLQGLGYSPDDAWYRLAAEVRGIPEGSKPPGGYTGSV